MPLRDIIVIAFTIISSLIGFLRPWFGVLALAVFAYVNPHRMAWGISVHLPLYFIVFMATLAGMIINGTDRQRLPLNRETILVFGLLLWYLLTTLISPDLPLAAKDKYIKIMKLYVGIFPTLILINSQNKFKWLFITIALSFGFFGFKGGIFAVMHGFQWKVFGPPDSFYTDNNDLALALNMTLPLLYCLATEIENKKAKLLFYSVFILTVFSIISSWSRGGLITLMVVLTGIFFNIKNKKKWLALPVLFIAALMFMENLPVGWVERMKTIEIYEEDGSMQGRFMAWRYAINRAKEDPLTGGGFETFLLNKVDPGWSDQYRSSHSIYFELLGEHGYFGLLIWISLYISTFLSLQRIRRTSPQLSHSSWMKNYARALQISLAAYAVGGLNLGAAYWDYYYHLVGLCIVMKVLLRHSQVDTEKEPLDSSSKYVKHVPQN